MANAWFDPYGTDMFIDLNDEENYPYIDDDAVE